MAKQRQRAGFIASKHRVQSDGFPGRLPEECGNARSAGNLGEDRIAEFPDS